MGIFSFQGKNREKNEKERKEEQFRKSVQEQLRELLDEKEKNQGLLDALATEVKQTGADVRRHDMALEDFLESLEEQQEEERVSRERIRALEQEQEALLQLLDVYQEQVWNMRRYAGGHDLAWIPQLDLVQNTVKGKMIPCGIVLIEEAGAKVDYLLHEVIEARDTAEEARAQTVAEVYRPGCIYKGSVRRKAKVAAYRWQRPEENRGEQE